MYITYNGITNTSLGLDLAEIDCPSKSSQKYDTLEIPGRTAPLWNIYPEYETYQIRARFIARYADNMNDIRAWLSGRGFIIFSDEPTIQRDVIACGVAGIKRNGSTNTINEITISFNAAPFAYLCNPETITLTNAATIDNPGSIYSEPIITVAGSGDITLTVNGESITLFDVDESITLDTPRRLAYRGNTVLLNKTSRDFLPMFCVGTNYISWTGNVTSVTIVPEWRWL